MRNVVFVLFAHRTDFAVDLVDELFLGFAPAQTVAQFLTESVVLFARGKGFVDARERRALRILGFAGQLAVGDDAADRFAQRLFAAFKERNDVVVALTHLAAVEARENFDVFIDLLEGQHEEFLASAVHVVKARGHIAGHFQVLNLIASHWDAVGVEHQNVGGHQNRVAEKTHGHAGVGVFARVLIGFQESLVGVRTVHEPLGAHAVQHPIEQRNFGDVALTVERHAFGVEAAGKPACRNLHAALFNAVGIVTFDERMQVGHEKEAFHVVAFGSLHAGAYGTAVVSEVKRARGVDAG